MVSLMTATTAVRTLSETELVDLVRRVAADRSCWEQHVDFTGAQRHWAKIEVPEGVDVWVISWQTFQSTDLHSHGDATAAFAAVQGTITEIRVDDLGRLMPRKFSPGVVQVVRPGEIHDVRNEVVEPAVTIHAYSPRLTEMYYYNWHNRTVTLDRIERSDGAQAREW